MDSIEIKDYNKLGGYPKFLFVEIASYYRYLKGDRHYITGLSCVLQKLIEGKPRLCCARDVSNVYTRETKDCSYYKGGLRTCNKKVVFYFLR